MSMQFTDDQTTVRIGKLYKLTRHKRGKHNTRKRQPTPTHPPTRRPRRDTDFNSYHPPFLLGHFAYKVYTHAHKLHIVMECASSGV